MNTSTPDEGRDDDLGRALRALPAAAARTDFVARVLVRAERAAARRGRLRRRSVAAAAGVLCVFVGAGIFRGEVAAERAARRAALIDEHRRLQGELEELRALADRRSQISLAGDATTDVYLDLNRLPVGTAGGGTNLR